MIQEVLLGNLDRLAQAAVTASRKLRDFPHACCVSHASTAGSLSTRPPQPGTTVDRDHSCTELHLLEHLASAVLEMPLKERLGLSDPHCAFHSLNLAVTFLLLFNCPEAVGHKAHPTPRGLRGILQEGMEEKWLWVNTSQVMYNIHWTSIY